jgi:hypothetical protein
VLIFEWYFKILHKRLSKSSKTTYETYANKLGITHVAKKDIPAEWYAECLKNGEDPKQLKLFLDKGLICELFLIYS